MLAAEEREERERKKAMRLQAMKSMPVLKRTEQVSNEVQHMIGSLSEAKSKWDQYEEVVRNIGSLKDKLAKAKAQMAHNLAPKSSVVRARKQKIKWRAGGRKEQAEKGQGQCQRVHDQSIRQELKRHQENLNNIQLYPQCKGRV